MLHILPGLCRQREDPLFTLRPITHEMVFLTDRPDDLCTQLGQILSQLAQVDSVTRECSRADGVIARRRAHWRTGSAVLKCEWAREELGTVCLGCRGDPLGQVRHHLVVPNRTFQSFRRTCRREERVRRTLVGRIEQERNRAGKGPSREGAGVDRNTATIPQGQSRDSDAAYDACTEIDENVELDGDGSETMRVAGMNVPTGRVFSPWALRLLQTRCRARAIHYEP